MIGRPYLKGQGNSSKDTVVDIVKRLFSQSTVASFDGGQQRAFNLEDVVDKSLLIFPDLPQQLSRVLGNVVPECSDAGGRVVRWSTAIWANILRNELPAIALQCVVACHNLRDCVGADDKEGAVTSMREVEVAFRKSARVGRVKWTGNRQGVREASEEGHVRRSL